MSDPNSDASSLYTLETKPIVLSPPKVVFVSNRRQCVSNNRTYCIPDGTYRWGFNDVPDDIIEEAQDQLDALALAAAQSAFAPSNGGLITINDNTIATPYPSPITVPSNLSFGPNLIPASATYNSGGVYLLTIATGVQYRISFGINEGDANLNGTQLSNGEMFTATASNLTIESSGLAGNIPVTASLQRVLGGMTGVIQSITVSLFGFAHTHPSDVWVGLTAPDNTTCLLMAACGGANVISGVEITFDNSAGQSLPQSTISSGTYLCTNHLGFLPNNPFASPAPQSGVWGADLSVFTGKQPNGTWNLWVTDNLAGNTGTISNGWSIAIQTN